MIYHICVTLHKHTHSINKLKIHSMKADKIRRNYTLEPKTVEIIERIAKEEKRKFNSVVDLAVQQLEAARQAANT